MVRKFKFSLLALLAVILASISFYTGCLVASPPAQSDNAGLELIGEAWNAIYQNYVEPSKINSENLSRSAIKGMMDALNDPYSAYLEPEMYKLFQSSLQGNFEGIGAQVNLNDDNKPVIIAPLPDSPAVKAGIKTGDIILAVNGKPTDGLSLIEVVLRIRGPAGTSVTVTILHEGETVPVDIELIRAQISTFTVSWEMKGDIAIIRILQFAQPTNDELNEALQSIDLKNTAGIILDLRSNPGGMVPSVVNVASHFIKEGVVITLVDNKGNRSSESVRPNGVFTDLPMVVLVDQFSASGAEVLTGALRDHQRATVAGNKTFGKGSYDINIPLQDGSVIYLTVGRWLTPNGQLIEGQGIEPDHVLTVTGDDGVQWAIDFLHKPK